MRRSDFLAFGTVRWMLRDLTIAMGHSDSIDYESLVRELLAGAHEWRIGDWSSAVNRLRSAFENLTQARERYYPVDAYLIDLCLIDPAMKEGVLAGPLERPIAISFLMPAQAIENQALHDPQRVAALRQAINDGWADVAGGTYAEAEDLLLPLESILWQFRRGGELYRLHLDDRSVETYARQAIWPAHSCSADRQAIRISICASHGLRCREIPDPGRDQAAVGKPRRRQPGKPDAAADCC